MNNIVKIIIKIFLITVLLAVLLCTYINKYTYAEDMSLKGDFDTSQWNPSSSTQHEEQKLKEIGNRIIGTIQVIGSIVSVLAIIIIGIRYMACSVEEKAQYKETMGPYFIGAVLVFGITTLLKIVYDIAQSVN